MRRLWLMAMIVFMWNTVFAQDDLSTSSTSNIFHTKADYHFERYEFQKAVAYYNRAFKKDTSDYLALLRMAESYSKLGLARQAEECYRIAFDSFTEIEYEFYLKYALALLVNKKYDESRHWLGLYNQAVEDDMRGANYLGSIDNQDELYKDSIIQVIENVYELNTKESDINPVPYRNQILFASSRTTVIDAISNGYYDILSAKYSPSGEFIKITPFNNSINSSFHEGPLGISGDESLLFFTRNITEKDSRNKVKLGIYKTLMPQGANDRLSLTSIHIDHFDYSIGHPAVNHDGTVMYFISNSIDGIGGLDIYKSKFIDGKWTYPENLGNVINTKGDEMFPFVHHDTVLYFASDGHGGLGGLDIYKVNLSKIPLQLSNLGYPINSRFDDFSIFPQVDGKTGYFCSNRHGGVGSDDIYKYDILNFKVKGSLLDAENRALLEDAKISVLMNNGEEYLVSKTENGDFEFSIIPGQSYTLIIEKEDYKAEEIFLNEDVTLELRRQMMIELEPLQKTEIKLEAGQKYNFISGHDSLDSEYDIDLDQIVSEFDTNNEYSQEINVLDKQMKFSEGGVYSMQFIKDQKLISHTLGDVPTIMLMGTDTVIVTEDSMLVSLPEEAETHLKLQTDLDHLSENFSVEDFSLNIDKSLILSEEITVLTAEEKQALKELEWLMSLSINTTATIETDPSIREITADGFSIIPRPGYILQVGKKSKGGIIREEIEIPLTGGVKYNFSSNPDVLHDYRDKLEALLENRKEIEIKTDKAIDISMLSKELEIKEGEEFSFSLLPDSTSLDADALDDSINSTIFLNDRSFEITSHEKFQINVPYTPERKVNINTDIDYLQENFEADEYSLDIDTIRFFSEILVDTTGYYKRFAGEKIMTLTAEEKQALKELEWLMSLSINTKTIEKEDPTIQSITSDGFSIIPRSGHTLIVGKKDANGDIKDELQIPLTSGVKYDFSSNPDIVHEYPEELKSLLESRKDIVLKSDHTFDISLLYKELSIKEGEEFSFSLLPDSTAPKDISFDTTTSTILLSDRTFDITGNEKFQINVPYTSDRKVNIKTDIEYLQDNFEADEISLELDTIPFFSEILIDTNGLYMRYLDGTVTSLSAEEQAALQELKLLMSLYINTPSDEKETPVRAIIADGFSIIPSIDYTLKVGKIDNEGDIKDELAIRLTKGVKYNFSSNSEAMSDSRKKLDLLLDDRKDVDIKSERAIDIALLSKELEIREGEEFSFSLLPDSAKVDAGATREEKTSTIYLNNRTFEITNDEKFQINVPYTPDRKVNINTDIEYLQENFEVDEINLDIDTIPFFSEILVDTTGYYKRYNEIEFERSNDLTDIPSAKKADIIYRVQIGASRNPMTEKSLQKKYTGNREIKHFTEDDWNKYYIADAPTYFEAKQILNDCGVKGAFIIAYEEGNKVSLRDAMSKQYMERMEKSGQTVGDSIINIVTVNFEFDQFSLRSDEENYLQDLVINKMKEIQNSYATVNGHTDIRGSNFYNIGLSNERAEYVKTIMIRKGISESRIKTFSFGESQVLKACEIPDDCDESVHQVNRRVEIVLFLPTEQEE